MWYQFDPRSTTAYSEKAFLLISAGRYEKAIDACEHPIQLDSHGTFAYLFHPGGRQCTHLLTTRFPSLASSLLLKSTGSKTLIFKPFYGTLYSIA
jgi:hypothetical protein